MRILKSGMVAVIAAGLSVGAAMPAFAQGKQEGLVNVAVFDVADIGVIDTDVDVVAIANVQVPVGIAANVCGIAANVLAQNVGGTGDAECNATATSAAENKQFMRFAEREGDATAILDAVSG